MVAPRKFAALAAGLIVAGTPFVLAGHAAAEPITGSCDGGVIHFNSDPIGLVPSSDNATFTGNFGGCNGTPASGATFNGNFIGTASCFDINGQVDGTMTWSNGEVSKVSGPWHVPGGVGAAATNTVDISDGPGTGGKLYVDQGPVNGGAMVGPCLIDQARNGEIPINGLRLS
ncbi:hypothetical protein AB0N05_32100 [Nocardia sp. NPDC051030]|uniref:hypothetical protein n=1 Tax=Nocardia sp. NPDC051030 TaxID=3155162 RepID=UPI00341EB70E